MTSNNPSGISAYRPCGRHRRKDRQRPGRGSGAERKRQGRPGKAARADV